MQPERASGPTEVCAEAALAEDERLVPHQSQTAGTGAVPDLQQGLQVDPEATGALRGEAPTTVLALALAAAVVAVLTAVPVGEEEEEGDEEGKVIVTGPDDHQSSPPSFSSPSSVPVLIAPIPSALALGAPAPLPGPRCRLTAVAGERSTLIAASEPSARGVRGARAAAVLALWQPQAQAQDDDDDEEEAAAVPVPVPASLGLRASSHSA